MTTRAGPLADDWNDTATPYERDESIPQIFERWASSHPERVAVELGDRRLTYQELDVAADRLAHRLAALGVSTDVRVAVAAERSIEAVVAFLGVLKAGGAYVPLDTQDPTSRLEFMLDDTDARALVVQDHLTDRLPAHKLDVVNLDPRLDAIAGESNERQVRMPGARDLAYVMYTSGSTGRPKGVAVEHRGVVRYTRSARELMPRPGEGMLQVCELDFDGSIFEIWGALLNGARLVIYPPGRPEPSLIGRTIREHGVAVAGPVTGLFHQLVDGELDTLGALRLVVVGGDVMSPARAKRFVDTHPDSRLINDYGPTEGTVDSSWHEVRTVDPGAAVPIGRPLPNTRLYVLDEQRRTVDPGAEGELYVGGDGVARGYLNLPQLTAERFLPDPFTGEPGARMYRTGDRVRLRPDGELEFVGRVDDQVKIRGFRVEPAEIESQLRACPAVTDAAVVARQDVPGHARLVAYVVLDREAAGSEEAARHFLEDRVPSHMLPSVFVAVGELPRTPRGKVDHTALPVPNDELSHRVEYRPPANDCEIELVRVWREALHADAVGVDDEFLELGGDSLLALRILVEVNGSFGVELPIDAVFQERTIARLAVRVQNELGNPSGPALPPIRREARKEAPASPAQSQACLEAEMAEDTLPYQFQALIHLDGVLDVGALERALTQIIRRHEILRTRFPKRNGSWWQVIERPFAVTLPVVDLSGNEDPQAALEILAADAFRTRIAADELPLMRWTLARLSAEHHVLVHVEHHLIHDGWSWTVFLREVAELYRTEVDGRASPLADPLLQFRDFAAWQSDLIESDLGQEQLDYWKRRLVDLPPPLELSFDRPRPLRQTYRGDELVTHLPPELADRMRAFSREQGVTLFMMMLSAFFLVMRRYSGKEDVVVGSGVSNRRLRESEDLLGMVLNTVALRVDVSAELTVTELLEQVREVTLDAFAHQDVPFEQVLENIAPARRAGYAPVYQVLFSFHDAPLPDLRLPGLTLRPDDTLGNGSAKTDLNVIVINRRGDNHAGSQSGELTLLWEYSTDLFDSDTAARMHDSYLIALEALVDQPGARVSELQILESRERDRVLAEAGPSTPYEREASIVDVFEARVREGRETIAIVADGTELSYDEVNRRANRLAHHLIGLGIGQETPVGVLLERSPDLIITLLAILKAGGAYVALDPALPGQRLEFLLDDTGAPLVCTDSRLRSALPDVGVRALCLDEADLADEPDHNPRSSISAMDLAYVAYTSGSTGAPKGVEVPHRAVVRLVRGIDYVDLTPSETLLAMAPLAFDASTFEIWGALLNGARLAVAPPLALSPHEIAELLERFGVTTLWLTAGLFHQFVDRCPDGVRGVRQLVAGGDVLSPAHVDRALRLLPPDGLFVNGYGPTEATTFTCCHRMPAGSRARGAIPIGRPISNTRVYILDEHREPVPIGVPGDLYIGGDGVARGYLGSPDLTAECFVPDPFVSDPDARLYRSGDVGRRRADGVIEFLGRVDRQVKIRGFRVEPGEIEHALFEHPAVREAAVVAHGEPYDKHLVAYVTPLDGNLRVESLRPFLSERLPAHALPAEWVVLTDMPLTHNGKVDCTALPEPSRRRAVRSSVARAPSRLERRMLEIWERVLDVRPIQVDDNFFDLGGHSLLAVELFATIQHVIGPRLPLATIFEAPTVEQLAEVVRREGWEAPWSSLVALNPAGSRPAFFCVAAGDANTVGYGALCRHLGPDQPFYALQQRGLDGRKPLQTRVDKMARHYVNSIRAVQEHGPYLLGGRCLGGLVAYEMARLLESAGETVGLLVIFDSLGPHWAPRSLANGMLFDEVMNLALLRAATEGTEFGDVFDPDGTAAFLAWLREPVAADGALAVNRYLFEAYLARPDVQAEYPEVPGADVGRLLDWGWVSGRREMGMAGQLLPPPTAAAAALRPPRQSRVSRFAAGVSTRTGDWLDVATRGRIPRLGARRESRLQDISRDSAESYRAGPYRGRITLLRSEEFLGDIEIARWYGVASGGVDERLVRGTHRSMVREPDVVSLAESLEGCIDAALDAGE